MRNSEKSGDGNAAVPPREANKEEDDSGRLEKLDLAATKNGAFSLSKESQVLVQKFTLVLKDLVDGIPTAYDLIKLINDASALPERNMK
jgi:hypothetical protein